MAVNPARHPRLVGTLTFDMTSCTAATTTTSSAQTLKGARTDMAFWVSRPATLNAGVFPVAMFCDAADTVKITFANVTAGNLDPASLSYDYIAF